MNTNDNETRVFVRLKYRTCSNLTLLEIINSLPDEIINFIGAFLIGGSYTTHFLHRATFPIFIRTKTHLEDILVQYHEIKNNISAQTYVKKTNEL